VTKVPVSVTNGSRDFVQIAFICGMKNHVLSIMVLLMSSCGLEQLGHGPHSGADGVWKGPSYGRYMSGTCHAVCLDYPDGYDWMADPGNGSTDCSVVMFADAVPVLRLSAGDSYEVSADPQRHRIRSGCLYTDFTDGMTTVIKKDGEEIIRYDGAEEVMDLVTVGGTVHMLCMPEGGTGFVYRIDGKEMVAREDGVLCGGLDVSGSSVGFCFECRSKYYKVVDGKVFLMEMEEDIGEIMDVALYNGELSLLTVTGDRPEPVLIRSEERRSLMFWKISDIVSCRFMDTDSLCVRIRYRHRDTGLTSDMLWLGALRILQPRQACLLSSVTVDRSGCHAVANPSETQSGAIFSNLERYELPPGYHVYGHGCAVVKDTVLHVGLTSGKGMSPVLWRDGVMDTLDVNGPLICLR